MMHVLLNHPRSAIAIITSTGCVVVGCDRILSETAINKEERLSIIRTNEARTQADVRVNKEERLSVIRTNEMMTQSKIGGMLKSIPMPMRWLCGGQKTLQC